MMIDGHAIEISNPSRVFFPKIGVTKRDMVRYYARVARYMLPYAHGRPVSMHRFPEGIEGEGFYHKEVPDYFPDFVDTARVRLKGDGSQKQVVVNNAATLAYLATQGCVTPHAWLSRVGHLTKPDVMIFDADPPDGRSFDRARDVVMWIADAVRARGGEPYVMLTGSRGAHVVVPLQSVSGFDAVREVARDISQSVADAHPGVCTLEMRMNTRRGRIFVDYVRNAYGQTSVLPYALRAVPEAAVATPVSWAEFGRGRMHARFFTISNIFRRLARVSDPWAGMDSHRCRLSDIRG